jgi:hypothetical protein
MKLKSWASPVALVVAILAIVVGAVWVTHGRGSGGSASLGRPGVLHLAALAGSGGAAAATLAAGTKDSAGGGGQYVLTGTLPDGQPDDQPVWRLSKPTASDALDVARALGLSGTPKRVDGGWVLRDGGNRLAVRDDGGWSYGMDCAPDTPVSDEDLTIGCAYASSTGVAVAAPPPDKPSPGVSPNASDNGNGSDANAGSGSGSSGGAPGCDPAADGCGMTTDPEPSDPPQPMPSYTPGPSDNEARTDAAPILDALGLGDADLVVYPGSPFTSVQVSPRVDGMATSGWFTSLQLDGDGKLVSADGWLSGLDKGDTYPLVSAQAAFGQLKDQPRPMMEMCMQRTDGKDGCAPIPPTEITGAKLGLSLDYDGSQAVLVPAWLFSVQDQPEAIAQLAVDPSFLAPPPGVQPGDVKPGEVKPGEPQSVPPVESSPADSPR